MKRNLGRSALTLFSLIVLGGAAACSPAGDDPDGGDGDGTGGQGTGGDGSGGLGSGGLGSGGLGSGGSGSGGDGSGGLGSGGLGSGGDGSGGLGTGGDGAGGGTPSDCSSMYRCDDFEASTAGAAPDSSDWSLELGWANDQSAAANVQVTAEDAHSGTQSVRIAAGGNGPFNFWAPPPSETFYTRAWIKMVDAAGNGSLQAVGSNHNDSEVRYRNHEGTVTLNSAGGDGLAPDPFNCSGDCTPIPTDWFCVEMFYDGTTDSATLWIGEQEAARVENNVGWHSGGSFAEAATFVWFGTLWHQGSAPLTYIDDVAIHSSRIYCN